MNAINKWNGAPSTSPSEILATNLSSNLALLPAPDANIVFQLKVVANGLPTKTKALHLGRASNSSCLFCGSARDDLRDHLLSACKITLQAKMKASISLGTPTTLSPLDHAMLSVHEGEDRADLIRQTLAVNRGIWKVYFDLVYKKKPADADLTLWGG